MLVNIQNGFSFRIQPKMVYYFREFLNSCFFPILISKYITELQAWQGSVQHNHWPRCKLQVKGQAEQDPDLPRSASNVLGKVQCHLCLTEWRGKWKCWKGKSTLGAACPAHENNILPPMLHPAGWKYFAYVYLIVRLTDFFVKEFFVRLQKKSKIKSGFQTLTVNVFHVKYFTTST